MEKTTITILCENRALGTNGIIGEHGFSALVEKDNEFILMDTGQGLGLTTNAKTLNIDLSLIRKIALSHGHYDHTGGLEAFAGQIGELDIYAHPDVFSAKFCSGKEGKKENQKLVEDLRKNGVEVLNFKSEIKSQLLFGQTFLQIPQSTHFFPSITG